MRLSRSTIGITAAALTVGAVAALGVASAQGGGFAAPPHRPPPPLPCNRFTVSGVIQRPAPTGCLDVGATPMWTPPVGAIDRAGHVVTAADQILGASTCCGFSGFTFHGHTLTADEIDFLRLPDGRVRLFVPDIHQIQTGTPSEAAASASSQFGVTAIPGEVEVAPAPLSSFPVRPGDNSPGWTSATGPG